MVRHLIGSVLLAAAFVAACGPSSTSKAPPAHDPAGLAAALDAHSVAPAPARARAPWQNPGGMWMPQQLAAQADTLRALGFELDPAKLGDPTAAPLGAMVSLGGCSATFVSADGLIVTNHHCVQGALQHNSTPADNLIENGYLARTREAEKFVGPTGRVFVAQKYTDVTASMTDGLAAITDDRARHDALDAREKSLLVTCEQDRPGIRCRVASFFEGAQWFLIEQLEIRDVRLVYAPARSIGNFGGEIDNWRWPRHTGDFAFYRAYVGPDGAPADHAAANVVFKPAHFLRVAKEPLHDGDLVMVAGYPGTTNRLATSWEVEEAAEWKYPRLIALHEQYLGVLVAAAAGDPELQIKAETKRRGLNNYLTKYRGQLETMSGGLVVKRLEQDRELLTWIDAEPARAARYRAAFEQLGLLHAERVKTREADVAFDDLLANAALLNAAVTIVRNAEERGKPDGERKLGYQQRDQQKLEQAQVALEKRYARALDRPVVEMFLARALALPLEQQPAFLDRLLGKKRDVVAIKVALDKLYAGSKLEDVKLRVELLRSATPRSLAKSKDPFIQLALAALPQIKAREAKAEAWKGARALHAPLYVGALREMRGGLLAPDANGTLRITYGTVQPSPKGGRAFTTVSELVAKVTGEDPFDAPPALLEAAKARSFGAYAAAELGELPVDFMSDVDITNGNSGSSTINARGELVGLAFDGTYESVASDWLYLAGITRTIHVDIRYVLWVMDAVDNADALLAELGIKPSL